mgnify:CR=1 FL=1
MRKTGSRLKSDAAPATVSELKAIEKATVHHAWEGDCPGPAQQADPLASPETGLNAHRKLRRATAVGELRRSHTRTLTRILPPQSHTQTPQHNNHHAGARGLPASVDYE